MRANPWKTPVALILLLSAGKAYPDEFSYSFFKQRRPLVVVEREFAALNPPGEHESSSASDLGNWHFSSKRANSAAFTSPVFETAEGGRAFPSPYLLIRFLDVPTERELHELRSHGEILETNWAGMENAFRVRTTYRQGEQVLSAANELAQRPNVLFAEPDMVFTGWGSAAPTDPGFPDSWALNNSAFPGVDLNAIPSWDATVGRASVRVLVIDTGVDFAHPDLAFLPGVDVTSDGASGLGNAINDCDNHGTPVAGCIGALRNNALGTTGVAPDCSLHSARAFISNPACDDSWTTFTSWTVEALVWAEDNGIRITNNSNVYGFSASSIASKYQETADAGMLHFAPTGNGGPGTIGFPATAGGVLPVSGIGPDGELTATSGFGPTTHFTGPDSGIYTTDRAGPLGADPGDFDWVSGTSMASAFVAGAAALVWSTNPALPAETVLEVLESTAQDWGPTGPDDMTGFGLPNLLAAVDAARPKFVRGDVNVDGLVNIADAVSSLGFQFSAESVSCEAALDANDDDLINVADAVFVLSFLFTPSSAPPPDPFQSCDSEVGPALFDCSEPCP